jgi:hypothetical protein
LKPENWLHPIHLCLKVNEKRRLFNPNFDLKTNDIEYAMAGGYIDQYGYPYRCGRVFER